MQTLLKMAPALAEQHRLSKKEAEQIMSTVRDLISQALEQGEDVLISDVGRLALVKRAARTGRNPQTGKEITIAAAKVPGFRAGKALKDAVN